LFGWNDHFKTKLLDLEPAGGDSRIEGIQRSSLQFLLEEPDCFLCIVCNLILEAVNGTSATPENSTRYS